MDAAHELIWSYSYGAVTIEAICDRAGVKKGSFYYFFDSKSELAISAINAWWLERKALLEKLFQPEIPPLDRICGYMDIVVQSQIEAYEQSGQVLGCPIFTLGSEICTQDERIRSLLQGILASVADRFEKAIRDAQQSGEIRGGDAKLLGRLLWSFYEGTLTRARIENNVKLLRALSADSLALLNVAPRVAGNRLESAVVST